MSNKKIFKKLYSEKINKDDNYKMILKSIERNNIKMKKNIVKWISVPACLIIVICGVVFLNKDNNDIIYKPSDPIISGEKNYEIYINSIESNKGLAKFDADIQMTNYYMIPYFKFLSNLDIPDDFDNKEDFKAIYVKKDKNSKEYDVLNHYELWCRNTANNRRIMIAFSNEYEPLRDYFFGDESSKVSKINDFELTIYRYENSYMTTFKYNDINFDIETTDITEQEFIDLLVSIIK